MKRTALIALTIALAVTGQAVAAANATTPPDVAAAARATTTEQRMNRAVPCWKSWQSVRDAQLHHTTPAGCGKAHRRPYRR
jgi:hypothetical protein